jgi:hypothetical protein
MKEETKIKINTLLDECDTLNIPDYEIIDSLEDLIKWYKNRKSTVNTEPLMGDEGLYNEQDIYSD